MKLFSDMKLNFFHLLQKLFVITLIWPFFLHSQNIIVSKKPLYSPLNQAMPFFEDWESLSFTTNNWEVSGNEWRIDSATGNSGASAMFDGSAGLTNYNSELTCDWIDSVNIGTIRLSFDLMLTDINATGTERLFVEVLSDSAWKAIDSVVNNGNISWENRTYNITRLVKYNNFKIRFRASGANTGNISGWFIDNVELYSKCDTPQEINARFNWSGNRNISCIISWESPELPIGFIPFMGYDHWENVSFLGLADGGNFTAAIRWDSGGLAMYDSCVVCKMAFFIDDISPNGYFTAKIWEGDSAANLIYQKTLTNIQPGIWTEITIDSIIYINSNLEYWFGYDVVSQSQGQYPAGYGLGPAVTGYGDLVRIDTNSWHTLTEYGFDNNWNIEIQLASYQNNDPGTFDTLLGYNIYRSFAGDTAYSFLNNVEQQDGVLYYEYEDSGIPVPVPENICYKVNAVWKNGADTCYSEFAPALNNPEEDHICLLYDNVDITGDTEADVTVYPNPAGAFLHISTGSYFKENIIEYNIYDVTGRFVEGGKPENNKIAVSNLNPGIYFIELLAKDFRVCKKFLKKQAAP